MSYDGVVEAVKANPDLAQQLHDAGTAGARSAILDSAGVANKPGPDSPDPTKDQLREMRDVAGGSTYFNATACGGA
ncbi:MAG: hypothetical protein WCJ50_05675 [Actinomycetes bacterium]